MVISKETGRNKEGHGEGEAEVKGERERGGRRTGRGR